MAISSSVHRRGAPSCGARDRLQLAVANHGVTIWAASPPYAASIVWNAGSSYAAAQPPGRSAGCVGPRDDRLTRKVHRVLVPERCDARSGDVLYAGCAAGPRWPVDAPSEPSTQEQREREQRVKDDADGEWLSPEHEREETPNAAAVTASGSSHRVRCTTYLCR